MDRQAKFYCKQKTFIQILLNLTLYFWWENIYCNVFVRRLQYLAAAKYS